MMMGGLLSGPLCAAADEEPLVSVRSWPFGYEVNRLVGAHLSTKLFQQVAGVGRLRPRLGWRGLLPNNRINHDLLECTAKGIDHI